MGKVELRWGSFGVEEIGYGFDQITLYMHVKFSNDKKMLKFKFLAEN